MHMNLEQWQSLQIIQLGPAEAQEWVTSVVNLEDHPYITSAYLWSFYTPPSLSAEIQYWTSAKLSHQHWAISSGHFTLQKHKKKFLPWGLSIYYVSIILDFFWPSHYRNKISIDLVLNISKMGHFLDPPTQSFADVINGWSLIQW
jgi:hypothetical protein